MKKLTMILSVGILVSLVFTSVKNGSIQLTTASALEAPKKIKYPIKPIEVIVPYGPGGGQDVVTRIVLSEISQHLGQPLVIINKPGDAGTLGTAIVASAKPDGYRILSTHTGLILEAPLTRKLPYSPDDLEPVIQLTSTMSIISAGPSSPIGTWDKLVDYARAHPGKLNIAVSGLMAGGHFVAEYAFHKAGISIIPIPMRGAAQATTAVIGGHVHLLVNTAVSSLEHIRKGTLRPILISSSIPELPNVTNFNDLGLKGLMSSRGIFVPKGTPQEIIDKLESAFGQALGNSKIQKLLKDSGEPADPMPSKDFKKAIGEEFEIYKELVKIMQSPKSTPSP